ncbi:DUF2835 domain-containing protein [Pseudoalteromonas ulvae]|uniref:DUF2835 domain-containing protein n=1 Tax=Pseudoalteromonas ulvae TaxID=107327 RepID=A0A244CME7_PSEDV|nr:DUF2835 domain-containing protein [Pseudoalteromonas ulvae]OUL56686.1 hypothetical protein B1199_15030 [Pseudoalteromonas ulvae]
MNEYYFSVSISYEECLQFYHGTVKSVQVISEQRKSIRLPAERFRPFISTLGIRGRFRLRLTSENQFVSLEKMS